MSEFVGPVLFAIHDSIAGKTSFLWLKSVNIHLSLLLSSRQPILQRKINVVICDTVPQLDQVGCALRETIDQIQSWCNTLLLFYCTV